MVIKSWYLGKYGVFIYCKWPSSPPLLPQWAECHAHARNPLYTRMLLMKIKSPIAMWTLLVRQHSWNVWEKLSWYSSLFLPVPLPLSCCALVDRWASTEEPGDEVQGFKERAKCTFSELYSIFLNISSMLFIFTCRENLKNNCNSISLGENWVTAFH